MERARHGWLLGDPAPQGVVQSLRRLAGAAAICLLAIAPHPARGQFTPRDGQIIARTLSFVETGSGGTLEIGIAYAPDHPGSVREATSLKAAIGDALVAGRVTLKARLIPVDQLPNASGIAGIFVTGELGAYADPLASAAQRLHIPTITTEMACVLSARCVLAFSSQPTVEIVLNHNAANSAGVHFTQAFRMLVREL